MRRDLKGGEEDTWPIWGIIPWHSLEDEGPRGYRGPSGNAYSDIGFARPVFGCCFHRSLPLRV
jgi:hypothetical protein